MKIGGLWPRRGGRTATGAAPRVELRIGSEMFAEIRKHVEDFRDGEQGAFVLCGYARVGPNDVLLARSWVPIPALRPGPTSARDHGLEWSARFSAEILGMADAATSALVLIHSHGSSTMPALSPIDQATARTLFPGFSRVLAGKPSGSIVLGAHAVGGVFWKDGRPHSDVACLKLVGAPLATWNAQTPTRAAGNRKGSDSKGRHARMLLAIGPESEAKLAGASVAVIGLCGGGSHVVQQLAHMGVGRIVVIDGDIVEDVNLGRMVGSKPDDAKKGRLKTKVMVRLVRAIDPSLTCEPISRPFPEPAVLAALKTCDLVVACVDSFLVREQINAFCRRHHLPLVDIGLGIKTDGERMVSAAGQLVVATPDSPCLRCGPLLSDSVLEAERRERPPGYDENENAPGAPQVISMNGTLASEAANVVLDFITGYSGGKRGAGWWLYEGRGGEVSRCDLPPRRADCPACAEQGLGDP